MSAQTQAGGPRPEYTVGRGTGMAPGGGDGAKLARAAPGAAPRKVAVLVAHGMGQQVPFQSIEEVAEGLRRHADEATHPETATVRDGDRWLTRARLHLRGDAGPVQVDVYEAYWAPLTEGRITLRDVIRFLAGAGLNGIRNGRGNFTRLLHGERWAFPVPVRAVLYLLGALLVLASLVLMNATILLVAAARPLLGETAKWLTAPLLGDLTATFNAVLATLGAFALCLLLSWALRRGWLRAGGRPGTFRHRCVRASGGLSAAVLFIALEVVVLAGVLVAAVFWWHAGGGPQQRAQLWLHLAGPGIVAGVERAFQLVLGVLVVAGLLAWLAPRRRRLGPEVRQDPRPDRNARLTAVAAAFLLLLLAVSAWVAFRVLAGRGTAPAAALAGGLSWPLLVVASAGIRGLLVQYVGDVAIYVSPYRLDRHYELREQIRGRAVDAARAVYKWRDADGGTYGSVVVMGHSLGSVVAYDALNRLILEDEAGARLDVVDRTPLFLTFGSPLDKTAFIFAVQGEKAVGRDALASTVQPMIRDYASRPRRWVNIHSPWDVISGPLNFYDVPGGSTGCVDNRRDERATTLLAAHVEYMGNPLLFETILDALGVPRKGPPASTPPG